MNQRLRHSPTGHQPVTDPPRGRPAHPLRGHPFLITTTCHRQIQVHALDQAEILQQVETLDQVEIHPILNFSMIFPVQRLTRRSGVEEAASTLFRRSFMPKMGS